MWMVNKTIYLAAHEILTCNVDEPVTNTLSSFPQIVLLPHSNCVTATFKLCSCHILVEFRISEYGNQGEQDRIAFIIGFFKFVDHMSHCDTYNNFHTFFNRRCLNH